MPCSRPRPNSPGQLTYLFEPRPVRFIAAEWVGGGGSQTSFQYQSGFLIETLVFAVGHVAQVEMSSDFIDLGKIAGDNRAKVIKSLLWEADLPPGARIQARTRSGNELQENFRYFRKDGNEVTAEQYDQMPKQLRGETQSTIGIGEDWSEWSNFYQRSGEQFLSSQPAPLRPSPTHPQLRPPDHCADCARPRNRIYRRLSRRSLRRGAAAHGRGGQAPALFVPHHAGVCVA